MIPKQKQESRSKGLSNPAQCRADGPQARDGQSADTGRTVRNPRADSPLIATKRPDVHANTRTVHTSSTGSSRATGAAQTDRDVKADCPPNTSWPKTTGQPDRNTGAQEHATNTKNPRPIRLRVDGLHPPGGLSARCEQAREQQPKSKPASTLPPILPWISQTASVLEERFGEDVKHP
jgi:hypothetical protein